MHADYAVLHRYVRLSSDRDLGSLADWASFIVVGGVPGRVPSLRELPGNACKAVDLTTACL